MQIQCRTCKGKGKGAPQTIRSPYTTRTVRYTCRYCKGTGVLEIDTRPLHEQWADEPKEIGELPDWMTGAED